MSMTVNGKSAKVSRMQQNDCFIVTGKELFVQLWKKSDFPQNFMNNSVGTKDIIPQAMLSALIYADMLKRTEKQKYNNDSEG